MHLATRETLTTVSHSSVTATSVNIDQRARRMGGAQRYPSPRRAIIANGHRGNAGMPPDHGGTSVPVNARSGSLQAAPPRKRKLTPCEAICEHFRHPAVRLAGGLKWTAEIATNLNGDWRRPA